MTEREQYRLELINLVLDNRALITEAEFITALRNASGAFPPKESSDLGDIEPTPILDFRGQPIDPGYIKVFGSMKAPEVMVASHRRDIEHSILLNSHIPERLKRHFVEAVLPTVPVKDWEDCALEFENDFAPRDDKS